MSEKTFLDTLVKLVGMGGEGTLLDAVIACLATAVIKKLFINKTKIDLTKAFDPTPFLPFVFALALVLVRIKTGSTSLLPSQAINAVLARGALSSCVYRLYAYFAKGGVKQKCKEPLFELIYNTLLNFGDAKQKLLDKSMTAESFISQVNLLRDHVKKIFTSTSQKEQRVEQIKVLFGGIVSTQSIEQIMPTLYEALSRMLDASK